MLGTKNKGEPYDTSRIDSCRKRAGHVAVMRRACHVACLICLSFSSSDNQSVEIYIISKDRNQFQFQLWDTTAGITIKSRLKKEAVKWNIKLAIALNPPLFSPPDQHNNINTVLFLTSKTKVKFIPREPRPFSSQ